MSSTNTSPGGVCVVSSTDACSGGVGVVSSTDTSPGGVGVVRGITATNSAATISVRIDARVHGVHDVAAMGSSIARSVVGSTDTCAGGVGAVGGRSVVCAVSIIPSVASSNSAATITVRVDARIRSVH